MLTKKHMFTGAIVLLAIVFLLLKYWQLMVNPWTRNGQVQAEIIQIAARVSGPIVELPVEDNQFVQAGELLFAIDPRTFMANLDHAQAIFDQTNDNYAAQEKQIEVALAQVNMAKASVLQAQSAIAQTMATIEKNRAELLRQQELLPLKATSQKSLDRAQANYEVSIEKRNGAQANLAVTEASFEQAKANLAKAKATLGDLGSANASIREAKANLDQAKLNLEFTKVRAPVDGYVTNLNLRLGSQIVTNQPILALVDVNSFWVNGYFKETSLKNIKKGDEAIVTLMTYPNQPLKGAVDSLGWGIAQSDGSTGYDLLPNISPTFDWIRLAQRIPVRVHLTDIPEGVVLRVGTTGSVLVKTNTSNMDSKPTQSNKNAKR